MKGSVMGLSTELVKFIFPPHIDDPHPAELRWRYSVFVTLVVVALGAAAHLWGYMPDRALADFQTEVADQMQSSEAKIDTLSRIVIEGEIRELRLAQCVKLEEGNREAARGYLRELNRRLEQYFEFFGTNYRLPPCGEL